MSAQAGWYPDPGGGQNLYRYWDGRAWSAATSPHPSAPPPALGLPGLAQPVSGQGFSGLPASHAGAVGQASGAAPAPGYGSVSGYGGYGGTPQPQSAYAQFQQTQQRRAPVGWWLAGAAVLLAVVLLIVFGVRTATSGGGLGLPGGEASQNSCPEPQEPTELPAPDPVDGRVHGGPVSYPMLPAPWGPVQSDTKVPFGSDALTQTVLDQAAYDGPGRNWVAQVLVAELQAGDGFFSPEQGSQIVVRCILGTFYGNAAVTSDVKVNKKATIDGHDAWIVESQLSFDIPNLRAHGERMIVAIISAGATSGLYYASIPDTRPGLVAPARKVLEQLRVDG